VTQVSQSAAVASGSAASINYTSGNMSALLQLMVACNGDVLKQHLTSTGRNATCISPMSQNAFIEAVSVRNIVTDVNKARFSTQF